MNWEILFEDQSLLVINKPAGVVVNRAETVERKTVQDWMEETKLKSLKSHQLDEEFVARSGMVHRLDKDTSGALLLAKNPTAFHKLKAQFKKRTIFKQYLTLVHGKLEPKAGTINLPIARNPRNRFRFTVRLKGRPASTKYTVDQYYRKNDHNYTLVAVQLLTGRTHQIRVHFQFLKHPVVADPLYLSAKRLKDDRWCPRLFLHAQKLGFIHPDTGERIMVEARLPKELEKALTKLVVVKEQVT